MAVEQKNPDNIVVVTSKLCKNLTQSDCLTMNTQRSKEFGKDEVKDFHVDYPPDSTFFFVTTGDQIVAFGTLIPISIEFNNKMYNILGFCNIISIIKGQGYGKKLISSMIKFVQKSNQTALGFCYSKVSPFYKKCGLNIEKDFIQRFRYRKRINDQVDKQTGKEKFEIVIDNEGDGLYIEGSDKFVSVVLAVNKKEHVFIDIPFW